MLSGEFQSTCLALRSPASRAGNPPPKHASRSSPISGGGRKVCRKEIHRSTGQFILYFGCNQLGEARNRYRVVWYATPDQNGRATPTFGLSVR